ncbi:NAD(P)-dependent dehydrogenase (Short-subunit alcohol dehydrogenase family) [Candidatus Methylobacter favarea]|uniref:NAD(P)-dependent dehydrogenase (Short-subunit alcohol dehydrogenase family) n=1 Tax=Candidatus Methylobacter favarea TaxID=2707345 RepID=A0A8S0WAZ7_9GAMM|nr:SDR family NAD(P)-dependent oxidoreductase [Candidatus Methylobacter favarea]CAA9891249.1 NAD(P)-dependent dehydrogenase (Short-subunit alcohol dehydrogenase family) [Candidatus Methylobacter favarea]
MPLTNQAILITGAGGGLGSTAALALAKKGAHIILLDKNIARLEAIYDAIVAAKAPEPIMYPFDLAGANEDEYQELADRIENKYSSLQGVLHSAVELIAFTPIASLPVHEWAHTLNVNLNAPFLLTRVLLPILQKSEHAAIVFTSDSSARTAPAYSGAYGVSNIALEGFAKILSEELESSRKIRVTIFIPGPVDSPLRKRTFPAEDKSKLPAMESLAPIYLYLFGSESIDITGQVVDARTFYL